MMSVSIGEVEELSEVCVKAVNDAGQCTTSSLIARVITAKGGRVRVWRLRGQWTATGGLQKCKRR